MNFYAALVPFPCILIGYFEVQDTDSYNERGKGRQGASRETHGQISFMAVHVSLHQYLGWTLTSPHGSFLFGLLSVLGPSQNSDYHNKSKRTITLVVMMPTSLWCPGTGITSFPSSGVSNKFGNLVTLIRL